MKDYKIISLTKTWGFKKNNYTKLNVSFYMNIFSKVNLTKQKIINQLPADPDLKNERRQVKNACFSFVHPRKTSKPTMISYMPDVAEILGLTEAEINHKEMLNILTGNTVLKHSKPYAMCYGGHQFGNWAGQLGDGRAINLFDVEHNDKQWTLQLKGSGETPYSRGADGLAVLRSSIREYLCSEAMFHLGVPTTRALSLSLTGDEVLRDMLYDGNSAMEKGAVVCRVAPSFLRFGSYEIFAARKDYENLKKLVDFTIEEYFGVEKKSAYTKDDYIAFFESVTTSTRKMIVEWLRVGFVHGVMNTDNMSILGLTIDYGPYGWLDNYDPNWTPNTTDRQHKRYRYGQQSSIGLWNLIRLANAIYPLVNDTQPFEEILSKYQLDFQTSYVEMMLSKLGLKMEGPEDLDYVRATESILQVVETDMTIFFRLLATVKMTDSVDLALEKIKEAFYIEDELDVEEKSQWSTWFSQYLERLKHQEVSDEERKEKMNKVNPKYVLRNYMAQLAIDDANKGDYTLLHTFQTLLRNPYEEQVEHEKWFSKRPDWARTKVGCSMLSCSS